MYKFYLKSLLILKNNRLATLSVILLLAFVCVFILSRNTFDNDIAAMLPEGSKAQQTLHFINKSKMANNVIISLRLKDSSHSLSDLRTRVEMLAGSLDSELIDKVDYKLTDNTPLDDLQAITPCLPQILSQKEINKLEESLNPNEADRLISSLYQRLISPAGLGQSEFISNDPFGLKTQFLQKLQSFKDVWGFKMAPGQNYFISTDLRNAMLIIHTSVSGTDTSNSRRLIEAIREKLETLPDWISADIVCSHLRAISNENIIKKDVRFTLILSFIGFILLFAFFYKYDFRCLLIILMPIFATLFVLAGMTFVFKETLLFVVGLGGVVVGIAVDYGIHIYSAMASGRHFRGAARVIRPLLAGGLTTFGVFAVFMLSDTPGYRQLGFFAGFSILLSLLMAVLFLPIIFFNIRIPRFPTRWLGNISEGVKKYPLITSVCWLVFMIISSFLFIQVSLTDDLRQMDGSKADIELTEKRFQETWQSSQRPAIVAVSGKSREEAAENAENTCDVLRIKTEGKFFCSTDIWPSLKTRQERLELFKRLAASGELDRLEFQINAAANRKGFADDAFKNFFEALRRGIEEPEKQTLPKAFQLLIEQTVNYSQGKYYSYIFFPDEANLVKHVRSLSANSVVISRNAFRQMLSEAVLERIFKLVCIALLLVVAITYILTGRIVQTMLALLPVASAIITAGAFFVLFAIPVNAAACIGAIVVIGLAIDYGIFMVNELDKKQSSNVMTAISLSSLTTLVGAGAVIFAVHPMLRSVGVVLCVGIFTAWMTAIVVIPAIWELFRKKKPIVMLFGVFILFWGAGCVTSPFKHPPLPILPQEPIEQQLKEFENSQNKSFSALSGIVFDWRSRKLSSLCVVDVEHKTRKIAVLGMNLMGVKLFEAAGDAEKAKLIYSALKLKLKDPDDFAYAMIRDIDRIYFDNIPKPPYSIVRRDKEIILSTLPNGSGVFKYYFGGSPLVLLKKQAFNDNILCWQIDYYEYKSLNNLLVPHAVFYRNEKYDYHFEVRLKEMTPKDYL